MMVVIPGYMMVGWQVLEKLVMMGVVVMMAVKEERSGAMVKREEKEM